MELANNSQSSHSVAPLRKLKRFLRHAFRTEPSARPLRKRPLLLEELETRRVLSGYAPTAAEQLFLERLNDARANPTAYGASVGVDLSGVAPSQPLAFDTRLVQSSRDHSQDMSTNNYFGHNGSDGSSPFQRMSNDGFPWVGAAESIAAGQPSPEAALQALIVDAGVSDLGHRKQLLSTGGAPYTSEQETGVGIVLNGSGSYHNYYTIDSGNTSDTRPILTGVVFTDTNSSTRYDIGEGVGNVTITIAGVGSTTTWGSGGYSFQLSPGTYNVTASGGGLAAPITRTVTVGPANYRLNFIANQAPPAAPGGLTATAVAPDQIRLAWNDVSGETGFKVERSPDGQTGWTQVSTNATGVTLLTDGGLSPSANYYYRVRATNSAGDSGYSNVANATTLAGTVSNLFADNFDSSAAGPAWKFVGGSWAQSGGVMQQTSTANGDPRKAMVTNQSYPADVAITARVRVDAWANGDWARAGVGLYTNTANGQGYNLLFHNNTSTVQFLDDGVKWGNSYTFSWQVGTWYWFKLEEQGGVLYGKVWADGTAEPSAWLFTQAGWTDRLSSGAPALNGGDTGTGVSTASFDAVSVANLGTPPATAPGNFTATAAGAHQINLSWSDVTGEAGFKVERSANGQTGWTQIGTTGAGVLSYQDKGLSASTTYYYRARAYNAAGDGPYSAVAQATTAAPTLPGTPTSLTATAVSSSQINLSWPDVSAESGFKVERSPDGQTGWGQIGTTAAGVLTYSDTGLNAGTTYYYRVRGTNVDGDGGYSPVASATPSNTVLFSDDFSGSSINPAWKFVGGSWSQANGALSQTSTANGDPRKALVTNQTFPPDVMVTARVRVDSWANGDYARAGVGLYTDPNTGRGYNLVFHNDTHTVQFLDDGVAWGNAYTFNWQPGVWYWFKLEEKAGVLYGKVWADGTAEPNAWMFTQAGWTDRQSSGAPALNGGSTGVGGSTASFSNVTVSTA